MAAERTIIIENDNTDMTATVSAVLPPSSTMLIDIPDYHVLQQSQRLSAEVEEGNHEYKLKLTNLCDEQINHRVTQLLWRLREGNDEAVYHIGVEDNGNPLGLSSEDLQKSLQTLKFMAEKANCDMIIQHLYSGEQGITAEVLMKRKLRTSLDNNQVTVAFAGDEDCGKSTIISVLSTGQLDNGKGLARMRVLKHDHEVATGHTSSVSHTLLHFDKFGQLLNAQHGNNRMRAFTDLEMAQQSTRCVSLIDLAGQAKYLKTTLYGLSALHPDHCLVCVSAVKGVQSMTAEHIGIGVSLQVPLGIVVTKCDLVHPTALEGLIETISNALCRPTICIRTQSDLVDYVDPTAESAVCPAQRVPIFLCSAVSGHGIDLLTSFLHQLSSSMVNTTIQTDHCVLRILGSFPRSVEDFGDDDGLSDDSNRRSLSYPLHARIYIGKVLQGTLKMSEELSIGPLPNGSFARVTLRSIRLNNIPVHGARSGQTVTFCVSMTSSVDLTAEASEVPLSEPNRRSSFAGMVLTSQPALCKSVYEFEALVTVIHSAIRANYEAVVHIGAVQQSAKVVEVLPSDESSNGEIQSENLSKRTISQGETKRCLLRFLYYPEVIAEGEKIIIREDRTKAVGKIVKCIA